MFCKRSDAGYTSPMDGVQMKVLVHGEKTMLCEFRIKEGKSIPTHEHPHEQTGYLVKGRMKFTVQDSEIEVKQGDSWCIPGGTPHSAEVIEDSIVIEVFSPPRDEYLQT
ncbi:MAG: cupin domain-containing protein [Deltaproteobacteria bacterium]|nr:MAG: cupin domain-containing protein [Deltaproteobacteria bacterium]